LRLKNRTLGVWHAGRKKIQEEREVTDGEVSARAYNGGGGSTRDEQESYPGAG